MGESAKQRILDATAVLEALRPFHERQPEIVSACQDYARHPNA